MQFSGRLLQYGWVITCSFPVVCCSMFAVGAGAQSVVACETSRTMYELAEDVLSANQMADRIRLVNKASTDLIIPDDLPKKFVICWCMLYC